MWGQSSASKAAPPEVRTEGRQFTVNGQPFLVRGIHYGPWRPRTGPNKGYAYPSQQDIGSDFDLIARAHANTVLIYDAPPEVLDLAAQHGLKVVYTFALDWYSVGGATQPETTARIVERAKALRDKPALLAWLLGNEVGGDVLQTRGDTPIVSGIHEMYAALKAVDPRHPISHANWPPSRHLALGFLDFASFNVYPLWPPEVVAKGFGPYIADVLRPIAGDRPLLISEFGVNTIEAGEDGQARLIRESWNGLIQAGAAGGIVFEFADEWWKNYNNPVRPGDWWTRLPAPDDELQHDEDPEEHYGLTKADRTPKPALAVVTELYGQYDARETARSAGGLAVGILTTVALLAWWWARRRHRRQYRQAA